MVKTRKLLALSSYIILLSASATFAHEFVPRKGECFLVKKNIPQESYNCIIDSGGGAGGSYTTFKINKVNILIEDSGDSLSIGNSVELLKDGDFYYRNLRDKKVISIEKARITPAYYCVKQNKGSLDACYIED